MFKSIVFVFFIIAFHQVSNAQWEKTSWQSDPSITHFAVDGSNIIIDPRYTPNIISDDSGETWKVIDGFSDYLPIRNVAIRGKLILIGGSGFLYVSTDFGKSWHDQHNGLPGNVSINTILLVDNNIVIATVGGVYVSENNGLSWQLISSSLVDLNGIALAANDSELFVIAYMKQGYKIYSSENFGDNWKELNNTILNSFYLKLITIDDLGNIFISTQNDPIDKVDNNIFVSSDKGNNWIKLENELFAREYINQLIAVGDRVFLSLDESLYYTADLGESWIDITPAIPRKMQRGINFLFKKDTNIYAASGSDIFVSTDLGDSWDTFRSVVNYGKVNSMKSVGNTLFVGTNSTSSLPTYEDCVYFSTNLGETWQRTGILEDYNIDIYSINDKIYTLNSGWSNLVSNDTGKTWNEFYPGFEYDVISQDRLKLSGSGSLLYSSYGDRGIMFSSDEGKSWSEKNNGLPIPQPSTKDIKATEDFVFLAFWNEIYMSDKNEENWINISNNLPENVTGISQIEYYNNKLYILTSVGLYKTEDMGNSWKFLSEDLNLNAFKDQKSLYIFDSTLAIVLKAYTPGIYISSDEGITWTDKSGIISECAYSNINISVIGEYIFAGSDTRSYGYDCMGIFKANKNDIITGIEENYLPDENLIAIFPNPAGEYLEIRNKSKTDKIEIYSFIGLKILETDFKKRINVSSLAKGVYLLRIGDQIKKFVKL